MDMQLVPLRKKTQPHLPQYCQMGPCLQIGDTIITTHSGMAALTTFENIFTPAAHPIFPQPGPPPWRTSAVAIDHTTINPDI
jgi:hypothetical protein